jgi:hypothetical protein
LLAPNASLRTDRSGSNERFVSEASRALVQQSSYFICYPALVASPNAAKRDSAPKLRSGTLRHGTSTRRERREEAMTTTFFRHVMMMGLVAFGLAFLVPTESEAVGVGKTCGGIAGIGCDPGMFCNFKVGSCHVADAQGKCVKVPTICNRLYRPVCGCDNKTYANNCERLAAKAQEDHAGKCK